MKASDGRDAAAVEGSATAPAPLADWQRLHFPSEAEWIRLSEEHPDTFGQDFYALPPWLRLGWPDEELYQRVTKSGAKIGRRAVATMPWAALQALYPDRPELGERDQDLARMARCWPDCFGQSVVEVELFLTEGITINNLTFGPGRHRVPASMAVDLRYIDSTARQHFIDQFIPKKHQDKVLATLSMAGSAASGELGE